MSKRSIVTVVLLVVGVAGVELFQQPSKAEESWMVFVLIFATTFFYFSDRLERIEKKVDALKELTKQNTA
jgi:hypothetical protein